MEILCINDFAIHHFVLISCRFTAKAPMCKSARESSTLFHEIGNCFLMLNNFASAREAGGKSLRTAEEAGDRNLQLQACVLNGLAEGIVGFDACSFRSLLSLSVRNCCLIEVYGGVFVLSHCFFLDFSVGVGAFVIGLSQISSFFSSDVSNAKHKH